MVKFRLFVLTVLTALCCRLIAFFLLREGAGIIDTDFLVDWEAFRKNPAAESLTFVSDFFSGASSYRPRACDNLRNAFAAKLSGQDHAVRSLLSAICGHIGNIGSHSPLVLLLTGPPGVGKSWATRLTAQVHTRQHHSMQGSRHLNFFTLGIRFVTNWISISFRQHVLAHTDNRWGCKRVRCKRYRPRQSSITP